MTEALISPSCREVNAAREGELSHQGTRWKGRVTGRQTAMSTRELFSGHLHHENPNIPSRNAVISETKNNMRSVRVKTGGFYKEELHQLMRTLVILKIKLS